MITAKSSTLEKEIGSPPQNWKFGDILTDPAIRQRWEKVRKFFFLRESTYDMTRRCNIRCEGCYYYEGDKQHARENTDAEAWRRLMRTIPPPASVPLDSL